MKDYEKFVQQIIKDKVHELQVLSDFIWNHHEILYKEYDSSTEICKYLEAQGFESDRGIANISALLLLFLDMEELLLEFLQSMMHYYHLRVLEC